MVKQYVPDLRQLNLCPPPTHHSLTISSCFTLDLTIFPPKQDTSYVAFYIVATISVDTGSECRKGSWLDSDYYEFDLLASLLGRLR